MYVHAQHSVLVPHSPFFSSPTDLSLELLLEILLLPDLAQSRHDSQKHLLLEGDQLHGPGRGDSPIGRERKAFGGTDRRGRNGREDERGG